MNVVLEQISRIDAEAYEKEQRNKFILDNEKQKLEDELKKYSVEQIKKVEENALTVYNQIINEAKKACELQENEKNAVAERIEAKYHEVEEDIIKKIMGEFFKAVK